MVSVIHFLVTTKRTNICQELNIVIVPQSLTPCIVIFCLILRTVQLTLVISNSMGPWKKFESTVVRLKRSYGNTGSVVCLTTKGRELEQNFEELKPASHVLILGTI